MMEAPGNCEKSCISDEHMILEHNEVTCKDLVWFLLHKDTKKWKFPRMMINSSSDYHHQDKYHEYKYCFEYRMIVVVFIFIQKLLQLVSIPLFWAGSKLEMWLNICSHNGNHSGVFLNLLRGKMVVPQPNWGTYLSFIGCLDRRMALHTHIKHGDPKFYSSLAVMASKLSYENKSYIQKTVTNVWKMEFLGFFDFWNDYQGKATTQAFIFKNKNVDPELTVVAFRGTETFDADAWCTDLDLSWFDLQKIMGKEKGKVHCGFMKALGLKKDEGWPENPKHDHKLAYYEIRKILKDVLSRNKNGKFIVTGHSLGGALAALFPSILAHHKEDFLLDRMEGVFTFGQPRVGDVKFGEFMSDMLKKHEIGYYRFVYGMDIVPRLPYDDAKLMFKHFGSCILFKESYMGEKMEDEPNKNYFSIRWAPKKFGMACKELKRSFDIHHDIYKEGWTMRFIRMVGLIFPGFSAHSLRDYDNSIRLAPDDVFLDVAKSVSQEKKSDRPSSYLG